jgi:hypothetical protein
VKSTIKYGLLAALLVLAVFAIAGHPLIPHDLLAGLGTAGMIPFAGELDMKGLKRPCEKQGTPGRNSRRPTTNASRSWPRASRSRPSKRSWPR